jgi:small-conductance mechanosensitive channel
VDGQRWTDGIHHYSDDGRYYQSQREASEDLVAFVGLLPDKSQQDQTAKIELLRTTLTQQTAEIDRLRSDNDRLQAEWRSEFNAAQQLRSQVEQLERLLCDAREELQQLQADQAADEQHSEGERAAYLGIIKALWEMRR